MSEEKKTVKLDEDLHTKLKTKAAEKKMTLQQLVRQYLKKQLDQNGNGS